MDRQFLEFWGNFLLAVAKGQQQLDTFSRWMAQGMQGFSELNAMFGKFYGVEYDKTQGQASWQSAQTAFETAYKSYLETVGLVPKSAYAALERRLAECQQSLDQKQTTITRLRAELSECRLSQGDTVRGFEELIKIQSDQFKEFSTSFNKLFSSDSDDDSGAEKK
jgi:hypothetical protein